MWMNAVSIVCPILLSVVHPVIVVCFATNLVRVITKFFAKNRPLND